MIKHDMVGFDVSDKELSPSENEGRVWAERDARAIARSSPVENQQIQYSEDQDDYCHRMIVIGSICIRDQSDGAALWLADTMATMRKNRTIKHPDAAVVRRSAAKTVGGPDFLNAALNRHSDFSQTR
jgi:hypothetical protein